MQPSDARQLRAERLLRRNARIQQTLGEYMLRLVLLCREAIHSGRRRRRVGGTPLARIRLIALMQANLRLVLREGDTRRLIHARCLVTGALKRGAAHARKRRGAAC